MATDLSTLAAAHAEWLRVGAKLGLEAKRDPHLADLRWAGWDARYREMKEELCALCLLVSEATGLSTADLWAEVEGGAS